MDWTDQAFLLTHLERVNRGELNQLRLAAEPGLAPVGNWQRNGVPEGAFNAAARG